MKNSKNKKKKKIVEKRTHYFKYCIITIIVILLIVTGYFFLTAKDSETKLTIIEKQWIMKNKNTLIDINIPNNLSVIGDDGKGVLFDYISKIEKDTELNFNKKSYNYPSSNLSGLSIAVLKNSDKLKATDELISEDNYVLISLKEEQIMDLSEIFGLKIGVLEENEKAIKESVGKSYTYESFDSVSKLITSLKNKKISYAIVPRYYCLKDIVSNKIYVNYTFDNLTNKIVLRLNDNERLNNILLKYLDNFRENDYINSYEKSFMNFYVDNSEITDVERSSLSSKIFHYGYVKGSSYNIKKGKNLYGYAGEYVNLLSHMANVDIEYKDYKDAKALESAITRGDVDFAFINFDYNDESGLFTKSKILPRMVALSETNYQLDKKQGLQNRKLYTVKNTYLEEYITKNYNSSLETVKSPSSSIPDDGILVIDEIDYYHYINSLGDYYTLFKDNYDAPYKFYVKSDEKVLYDFVNFMVTYADSSDIKANSINKLALNSLNEGEFKQLYLIVVLLVVIPVIVLFALIALTKNRKNIKLLRKEDVLKYNDMLTSLKNRNYLRANIEEWDDAKITPRAVIIIDLNNLKYVNDNYGQEEGNVLIKKAAAILINTQLEKSEIIRTDGNEFLIYSIGYNKTQINTYINKLSKEFEKLPYNFGAAIGFSMIEDEIKTIDDAINEASIAMRKDKEENYK